MDLTLLSVVGLVALALCFDYTNGFHDSANSVATVIATRVLRPRLAVLWAAGWNFVAFLVFGTAVADTVGSTVRTADIGLAVIGATLIGAIAWNLASWHLGIPTSSSHALVGGLVGAGVARGGFDAIKGSSVQKTVVFIVLSPVAGLLLGALVMLLLRVALRGRDVPATERGFRRAQLASSAAVSLGHGGNDAQKTMGVIAALLVATGHLAGGSGKLDIPLWVVLAAHAAIAAGTFSGGWRIVRTVGTQITTLRPVSGFAAETGAAVALFGSTAFGAPVSTTHTVAGAVAGAGAANAGAPVHWSVFRSLVAAWVVTLPVTALVSAAVYELEVQPPPVVAAVAVGALLVALAVGVAWSLRSAPSAQEVADDAPSDEAYDDASAERPVAMRPGAGSVLVGSPL